MGEQPRMMVMIGTDDIAALRADIAALARKIEGATVQPLPEWCSVNDAARRLGVSTATIRRKVSIGQIEARGSGKTKLVRI